TEDDIASIDAIANEAATIIAEFNEGLSNRQTWNSAALAAIATWFGDEELAITAIEGRTGLLGHLADGFGADGMWFEGENYHLFALRGLLVGLQWSAAAGAELLADDAIAAHLGEALMAPTYTALPDFTFPARKDARYGVSLAHPAYLECWESGLALLGDSAPSGIASWLQALYAVPPHKELTYDAYLHDAGLTLPDHRSRADLSWWALLTMVPALPAEPPPWVGVTRLMTQQQLGVLRSGTHYLSLECGGGGSGHGHPDRLHLTLHAGGVHWLADPGTGLYTSRDLFWYRSTLAHNAPMIDGRDQDGGLPARCTSFDASGEWSWCVGSWGELRRTIICGPNWAVDLLEFDSREPREVYLPWHVAGETEVTSPGGWEATHFTNDFVDGAERFAAGILDRAVVEARRDDASLRLWFAGQGELLRANGPGLPGTTERQRFYIRSATGNSARMVTVLDFTGTVTAVEQRNSAVEVRCGDALTTVQITPEEATVSEGADRTVLAGPQPQPIPPVTFVQDRPLVTAGELIWVSAPPALDGTLDGFDRSAPLALDEEHHYFRSEEPYAGPEEFSATCYTNWSDDELYLAVEVVKDGLVIRPPDAPPLNLDNEPEDINADGIQVYWRDQDRRAHGWLIRLAAGGSLISRSTTDANDAAVSGAWSPTSNGYRITVRIPCPNLVALRRHERLGFDLIVNEMREGRMRRAGQLIWSGGPGWVYLRGDRHDPSRFGEL
ncbi:MAG: heparinase II/III family protein, partial [Gemmatimonadota bacterium]